MDNKKVPVFISRWADYSDRFVFQLSSGGLGVLSKDGGKQGMKKMAAPAAMLPDRKQA